MDFQPSHLVQCSKAAKCKEEETENSTNAPPLEAFGCGSTKVQKDSLDRAPPKAAVTLARVLEVLEELLR